MDRLVPFVKLAQRFLLVTTPHAGGDDPGYAALRPHGIAKVFAAIGAVGKDLAGIIRQCFRACLAVIDIGGGDRNLLDQRGIGVGTYMGLEAMYGSLSLVLYPACVAVSLAGRRNDG